MPYALPKHHNTTRHFGQAKSGRKCWMRKGEKGREMTEGTRCLPSKTDEAAPGMEKHPDFSPEKEVISRKYRSVADFFFFHPTFPTVFEPTKVSGSVVVFSPENI